MGDPIPKYLCATTLISLQVTKNVQTATVQPLIEGTVILGSIVYTDEYAIYNFLDQSTAYQHQTVCHSRKEYATDGDGHWCTNRHFDKNIVGLLFFHHFHLKIWLSWHLAQQGKVQVVIK